MKFHCLWIKFVLLTFLYSPELAQSLTIKSTNTWNGIFADTATPYEIVLSGEQNTHYSLTWTLKSKGRTLSNGRQTIRFSNSNAIATTLPLRTPPVKSGVNVEAELIITIINEVNSEQSTRYETKLNIYGPDLLLTDKHFYKKLNIQLFDPIGKTAKIFDDLKIPYETRTKSQLINIKQKGLIIVGEETALDQERGLINSLIKLASQGQRVLILQPSSGEIPIPELSTHAGIQTSSMSFANDSIVQSFAKGYAWIEDSSIKTHGITLDSHRQMISARIVKNQPTNWDWFQLNFNQSGGQFIICMLSFTKHIDKNPVPQIIFSQLLAYTNRPLTETTEPAQRKKQ